MRIAVNGTNQNEVKTSTSINSADKYVSSEAKEDKYLKELKKKYSTLNLKVNSMNIFSDNKTTVTLSPDLIKKACKDKEVDESIRKSLDDAVKYKKAFKNYNYTKDGHKVKSVSFFIDRREKISCSIRLNKDVDINTKEEKRNISLMISSACANVYNRCDVKTSLFYKYISLLNENNFNSLDVSV